MWQITDHLCGVREAEAVDQKFIAELTLLLYRSDLEPAAKDAVSRRIVSWQIRLRSIRANINRALLHKSVRLKLSVDEVEVLGEITETFLTQSLSLIIDWYTYLPDEDRLGVIDPSRSKVDVLIDCIRQGFDYLGTDVPSINYVQAVLAVSNIPIELLLILRESYAKAPEYRKPLEQVVSLIGRCVLYEIYPIAKESQDFAEFRVYLEKVMAKNRQYF